MMRSRSPRPPHPPRRRALAAVLPALVLAAACSGGGDPVARDEATADPPAPELMPVPTGAVRTVDLATVMDTGDGPVELCLGAVAESYPPQCGGPAIANWDWQTHGGGGFEEQSGVRWGLYSLTGTWDGSEFTVSDTIIAALYDSFYEEPPAPPEPESAYSTTELEEIAAEASALPGAQDSSVDAEHVYLDVTYDDGSIQDYVDQEYGANVVLVTSVLVDVV